MTTFACLQNRAQFRCRVLNFPWSTKKVKWGSQIEDDDDDDADDDDDDNNNGYLERLTRTGPKSFHIL